MVRLFLLLFSVSNLIFAQEANYKAVFSEQRLAQGEKHIEIALESFKDKRYQDSISRLNDFLFLFPGHPSSLKALKLLSQSYKKNDELESSIQTDLKIYRENPTIEDGISSYLDAGRKLLLSGRHKEGKKILEHVKTQMYSTKLAKEAEIELNQYRILEEENHYFKEDSAKNENNQNPIK
jgi:TolA-binding protein